MKTMSKAQKPTMPLIQPTGDYEIIFDDLELAFRKKQLKDIALFYNHGKEPEEIAKTMQRHPLEIFLALVDLARKNKLKRPFAYRRLKHGKARDVTTAY
ncbi:hypothetical protein CAI16_05300 [Virgibacillus dokdonensis]|uniref:Uncharacterized protein n=1 Tax=Virgibacillus dokdonensis TaxID=302167 RepID=A0A3E0WTA4_9BACI|nr:hypothetical protein [Virgibacillus dokdonensis]RFA36210.1 hypothetical protein CAI16_05300 [Virgibacillus dokdonensis]